MIEEIQTDGTRVEKTLDEIRPFLEKIDVDMIGDNPPEVVIFPLEDGKTLSIPLAELNKVTLRKLRLKEII